jgi:hypothetical protein
MAFCKFCGKELGEDNKCTCAEFQDNERNAEMFIKSTETSEDKPIKRGGTLKYIVAFLCLALIIVLVILIAAASASYKAPIQDLTKGIRKADSQLIIESMYTDMAVAELSLKAKENQLTWDEYIRTNNKAIESAIDGLGIKRLKVEILAKEKLSGSNFDKIERYYKKTFNADAKKAYRVEVEFTYKENGIKSTAKGWLCVVKLKGEGWKFCPQYSQDNFNFIDQSIKFE